MISNYQFKEILVRVEEEEFVLTEVANIGSTRVIELMRCGILRFVIVNIGSEPQVFSHKESYGLWKSEIKERLVEPEDFEEGFSLEDYPGEYAYVGFEYSQNNISSMDIFIVLKMYH